MLRSLNFLRRTALPSTLIAGCDEHITLVGGGVDYAKPWHWHDGLMLLLPCLGVLNLKHEARRDGVWVSPDRFAVVPASHPHDTSALQSDQTHVAVYLRDEAFQRIERQLGSLSRVRALIRTSAMFSVNPDIRALKALCRDETGDAIGQGAVRAHLSAALLIRCLTAIERGQPLGTGSRDSHATILIDEVKAFVAQRADQTLSIDLLSERFNVSRRHITRLFRERTGLSIGAFQQGVRLAEARRLLKTTDLPIDEVAFRVGFESGSALARALRRRDGLAPREVRARSAAMARTVAR
ncbi:helix-turn-helix domain-containing protein [Methylobacterium sp. J-026]|uniref:helix-turn-helix domain-containing protein n=1 Tax=Methylobacterium sp. J-026 TaxID=2836624 RepID=UPI001FBA1122|nr:helix-turn-helix domain-containing protein [Methylobacterium sp. J-026]MCJ2136388.1 helix-turn-helix domain-containing protein [Methylobacterium sp. J-026]